MSALTRQQARALALTLYYSAAGRHDLDDNQFNIILDTVNKKYWMQAVGGIASLLAVDSPDTTTTTAGEYDYSGTNLDPNGVYQLLAVEFKFQNSRYLHLDYIIPQDRQRYNLAYGQVQALVPSAFCLLGEKIVLAPRLSGPLTLRITYVPNIADLTTDGTVLLNGKLQSFHQLVAYETAALLLPKDADRGAVTSAAGEMKAAFKDYLQSRQRQMGRQIREIPWD